MIKVYSRELLFERRALVQYYESFRLYVQASGGVKACLPLCRACSLRQDAKAPVLPEGRLDADVVIYNRNPGVWDDHTGVSFYSGSAVGGMFGRYMDVLGLHRGDVYITSAAFCHGKDHRQITTPELYTCFCWKLIEFSILTSMQFLILVGNDSLRQVFGGDTPSIVRVFGDIYKKVYRGKDLYILPVYHPAYVLRNPSVYTPVMSVLKEFGSLIRKVRDGG